MKVKDICDKLGLPAHAKMALSAIAGPAVMNKDIRPKFDCEARTCSLLVDGQEAGMWLMEELEGGENDQIEPVRSGPE